MTLGWLGAQVPFPTATALKVITKHAMIAADAGGQLAVDKIHAAVLALAPKREAWDDVAPSPGEYPSQGIPSSFIDPWDTPSSWYDARRQGLVRKGVIPENPDGKWTVQELLARGVGWGAEHGEFTFHLRDPLLIKELTNRGTRIVGEIGQTQLQDFRDILVQQFYKEGLGPKQLAQQVHVIFPHTYWGRGLTIAETETQFALQTTQFAAYRENGVDGKTWTAMMRDTREDHVAVNGITKPIDEAFLVGGTMMMHPGQDGAPAKQVVRCHCDLLPEVVLESELRATPWLGQDRDEEQRKAKTPRNLPAATGTQGAPAKRTTTGTRARRDTGE